VARRYKHGKHADFCRKCACARGIWGSQRRHWEDSTALEAMRALASRLDRTPGKRDWDKYRVTVPDLPSADSLRDRFGSWRKTQKAAGLEPNDPHRKITGARAGERPATSNRQMVTGGDTGAKRIPEHA
jgi:hypothetical protein